jgi:monovalent cation:H+ antiporter, CPA1 family
MDIFTIITLLVVLSSIFGYLVLKLPIALFNKKLKFVPHTDFIMTWGGLRGGISIVLPLSLSENMDREFFLAVTYVFVIFSIIVQGLTIEKLIKKLGISVEVRKDAH